jgi:hypothetical protein
MNDAIKSAALAAQVIRKEADRKSAPRTRPNTLGGMRLKLAVYGEIDGFHLYWANDEDNEIEELLYDGFEFVAAAEVHMESRIVQDADVTSKVSRFVGTKADGSPLRAYLMKCREDIWQDRQSAGQEQANAWDSAILAGSVGAVDGRYQPKGLETKLSRHNQ